TDLFDTQARVVPDVTATQGGIAAVETFRASDLMSRAGSIITGAFGSDALDRDDYLLFVSLVGAYHADLADVAGHLRPTVAQQYADLTASTPWRSLVAAENALIGAGRWSGGVPRSLAVSAVSWQTLTSQISDALIKLTIAQADEVSAQALTTGDNQLYTALGGSVIALALVVAAVLWALRQSRVLVDRALSVRLDQLGRDATTVVDRQLPEMMDRIARRQAVNAAVELPHHDYGDDEIGRLAEALNRSLRIAVGAAVDEAATRAAATAMLMGVARRPQRPLQHALQVVGRLQGQIADDELLAALFDVNHQLAQARRYLENLIILAGGYLGRRFHKPVALRRVLLATIGETQQYQRIALRRTVDVALVGSAVAGVTHLLAELLDNAVAFSPPGSPVWASCTRAARGVVVEIEDAGVGMLPEDLEHANQLLASAPTPDATVLRDAAQLGLWVVAELAKRDGIQVSLRTSAYGGLLAIVLLPERLIAADADVAQRAAVMPAEVGALSTAFDAAPAAVAALPTTALRGSVTAVVSEVDSEPEPVPVEPGVRSDIEAAVPSSAVAPAAGSALATGTTPRPPLPERTPQQHLAPQLRDSSGLESGEPVVRSPEETASRFARYQQGWQAARSQSVATGNDQDGKNDGLDAAG
ncbi:MAG: sensor histidine kinase, partial [Micromonosporaceae bacterium]|nr:sensor histidine kinase [Micromonosporaceae bacterium]